MLLKYHEPSKLRTENVVFQDWRHALDANSLELLRDLTATRRHVANAQAGIRPSEAVARELHGGIKERSLQDLRNIEKYVPLFENLLAFALPIQLSENFSWWRKTLKLRWNSPLSWGASHGSEWGGPRLYSCDDLRYEYAMILTLYATLLRERAMEEVEVDAPQEAIRRLREAAGIYDYLSSQVLGELTTVLTNVNDRPVEVSPSMALAWKHICLGEAQAVTVQMAEKKKISLGSLANLHKGCAELYEKALVLIEDNKSEWRELSEKFLRYLKVSKALHELKMRRYLADFAKSDDDGMGKAVKLLRIAKAQLLERVPGDEEWRVVYTREVEAFEKHFRTAVYDNDNIYRHKEPLEANLPSPTSKILVEPVPYKKSTPLRDFHFT